MGSCGHVAQQLAPDHVCPICGERGRGRPRGPRLAEAFALGRQAAGGEGAQPVEPEPRPSWLRWDGRLKVALRDPPRYVRKRESAVEREVEQPKANPLTNPRDTLRRLDARICRTSLAEFVKRAWHVTDPVTPLDWNWHHESLCTLLQRMFFDWLAVVRGQKPKLDVQNIIINIPPGTAKSRFTSVFFPVWAWLHEPHWRPLGVSLNPKVADRDALASRNLIESAWFRETFAPEWRLDPTINARGHYENTLGGGRESFGMGATITGLRYDAIIVDDPNDAQQIHSQAHRENVNINVWDMTLGNRLNDLESGLRIIIQQRLGEDDLSGHLLRKGGFAHARIPLLYETKHDCPCPTCVDGGLIGGFRYDKRSADGENLHPSRFSEAVIDFERKRLGSFGFAGQMQQRPAPEGGAVFKRAWFKRYEALPEKFDDVIIAADLANKLTTAGSFNVLAVYGKKGPWRYVLDVRRNRGEWTANKISELIKQMQIEWKGRLGLLPKILVEDKAMGPTVIMSLQQDLGVQGVLQDEEAQKARDDKYSRAMAVQPIVEGGNVMIPAGAPWVDEYLHELTTFPLSANDDQVDTFSMALNYWRLTSDAARFMAAWSR